MKNVESNVKAKVGGAGVGGGGKQRNKVAASVSPPTERFIKDYSSFDSDSDSMDESGHQQRPPRNKKKMKVKFYSVSDIGSNCIHGLFPTAYTFFLLGNSIFHLSLEVLMKFCKMGLKVA